MSEKQEDDIASQIMMDAAITGLAVHSVEPNGTWTRIAPEDFMAKVTIPDDIRASAARAVGPTIDPRGQLATRVAEAIHAERTRGELWAQRAYEAGRNSILNPGENSQGGV